MICGRSCLARWKCVSTTTEGTSHLARSPTTWYRMTVVYEWVSYDQARNRVTWVVVSALAFKGRNYKCTLRVSVVYLRKTSRRVRPQNSTSRHKILRIVLHISDWDYNLLVYPFWLRQLVDTARYLQQGGFWDWTSLQRFPDNYIFFGLSKVCCVHCEDFHRHKFRCNFTADRAVRGDLRALTFEHAMETRPRTLNHAVLVFLLYFTNGGFSSAQNGIPDGAGSLVFVFDTTGSMYDDLIQVRAGASKILSTTLERKVKPLYNYVLIPFHDPGKSRDQCKLFLIPFEPNEVFPLHSAFMF